jgi:acyl carrier protein
MTTAPSGVNTGPEDGSAIGELTARIVRLLESRLHLAVAIEPSTRLDALGIDSLGTAELLFEMELVLGVIVPEEAFIDVLTVGDVVAVLQSRVEHERGR